MENRRRFLDDFKMKFQVKNPMDWGHITVRQISAAGGAGLLNYYSGSLFKSLQSVYAGILLCISHNYKK